MTNQPPFNMQYYLSVLITKTVLYLLQTDALVFPILQPGESKQKQHNSCSAESFLHGPILPHELWVKPYSGISPRPNQIIKSEHSWHNPVHVFTEIMYFTEILKFCLFFFSEILNSSYCGVHRLSFNLYKMQGWPCCIYSEEYSGKFSHHTTEVITMGDAGQHWPALPSPRASSAIKCLHLQFSYMQNSPQFYLHMSSYQCKENPLVN